VCLKGNIDPSAVMLQGTPEEVRAAARRCIEAAGYNGGFILSPGCELPRDTPHANVWALMEAAREFGTYPLQNAGASEGMGGNEVKG
jgi:uroporphyrinogen decarboxylase